VKVAVDIEVRCEFLLEIGDDAAELVTGCVPWRAGHRQPIQIAATALQASAPLKGSRMARWQERRASGWLPSHAFGHPRCPTMKAQSCHANAPKCQTIQAFVAFRTSGLPSARPSTITIAAIARVKGHCAPSVRVHLKATAHPVLCPASRPVSAVDRPIGSRYHARS